MGANESTFSERAAASDRVKERDMLSQFYHKAIAAFVKQHVSVRRGAFVNNDVLMYAFLAFCDRDGRPLPSSPDESDINRRTLIRHIAAAAVAEEASEETIEIMIQRVGNSAGFVVNMELTSFPSFFINNADGMGSKFSDVQYEWIRHKAG
jgi:hypothetical protein